MKSIDKPSRKWRFISSLLSIHGHRYFRGLFMVILLLHMVLLVLPQVDIQLPAPDFLRNLLKLLARLWPFPTFKMLISGSLYVRALVLKSLEISVILLYAVDLLPKIFIWRQVFLWRMLNILIVTLMVAQLPATLITFDQGAIPADRVRLRVFSISLSFVLLCEILSIREQRTLRLIQVKKLTNNNNNNNDNNTNTNNNNNDSLRYREYSWCEVVKHDKQGDCWIVINGLVYDVSEFIAYHPGGPMIYDGAGGDCTALWYSYHPSQQTQLPPPQKYLIGNIRDYVSFYSYDGKFYEEVKQSVEKKIPRNNMQNHYQLYLKCIAIIPIYFISMYFYITYCNIWSSIFLGFMASQVGVNIMHDGNHAAFSSNKWVSLIAGYALDLTFSTSVVYRRSHNFGHHGCVNHYELDRSFDTTYPLLRLHPLQPRLRMHRYQHFYVWFLYGLTNFGDVFGTFDELQWISNFPTRRGYVSLTQVLIQISVKAAWVTFTMLIPSYLHGWFNIFPIWFLYMVAHSYGYTLFFAVNHWTVETGIVDNSNISETNWGALQVTNSSNFQTKSRFWSHLSGGLNYQIEHHLFPQICHTRLPEIQQIVKDVSAKYNLRYFEFPTFLSALKSHYKLLKLLGQQDDFIRNI